MATKATLKDVIYALEYGHEQLIGSASPRGLRWSLSVSRIAVDGHTVDQARLDPNVISLGDWSGAAHYGWKAAA